MNTKILFIMHMPPPVHGAAMVGKYIHDSKLRILKTDIFVFPTFYHNETFGLVLLEAMDCNIPQKSSLTENNST